MKKEDYVSDVWKDGIFRDRVVFCTGGSGTICSAQVRALVHLGANACIVGRNKSKVEAVSKDIQACRAGSKVLAIGEIDVRRMESLEAAVDACVKELGGIDYVIAGAAGNFLAPISALSPNAMKSVIDIDVLGSYHTLKATLPHLISSAAASSSKPSNALTGRIIFVSATLHYAGTPLQSHVAMAKAGVDALSNATALEYGPRGIRSNVIAPGPIGGTEGMERLSRKEDAEKGQKAVPVGRWGTVKEIADATVYLFADTGSFVNGTAIVVDGGAWRTQGAGMGGAVEYPGFLLSGKEVEGVKGGRQRKEKAKL